MEQFLCLACRLDLPRTDYHKDLENPVQQTFTGRISVQLACSQFYFFKDQKVQDILHAIKYEGAQGLATGLGLEYGKALKQSVLASADCLLPIPLHKKKFKQRGFNQAQAYADGISEGLDIPTVSDCLERNTYTKTQTKLSRAKRWENVKQAFDCVLPEKVKGKHVVLVDDVITTGATLEAAALNLVTAGAAAISMVSLAHAP